MFFYVSDFTDNRVLGIDDSRSVGQSNCNIRGGQTRSNANLPEPLHSELGNIGHDAVLGVHAIHVNFHTATPMDYGNRFLQTSAVTTGHQYHGVGRHDHSNRHRPVLGDRSRVRAKRTAYCVRVHSYGVVVGSLDHVSRSLLSG